MSEANKNSKAYFENYRSEGDQSVHVAVNEGNINQNILDQSTVTHFNVNPMYKDELPGLYSRALEDFEKRVNEYLRQLKVDNPQRAVTIDKDVRNLETSTNDLADEIKSDLPGTIDENKKASVWEKLKRVGINLMKFLPEGVSIGLAMTPLAPIATLAGKATGELVKELIGTDSS
jgi:gas vesicle protein